MVNLILILFQVVITVAVTLIVGKEIIISLSRQVLRNYNLNMIKMLFMKSRRYKRKKVITTRIIIIINKTMKI